MKLLTRYNRVNIMATIVVLLLGGFCYYFILKTVLLDQLDDDLKVEQQEIIDYVKENNSLPETADYKDQKIAFELTTSAVPTTFTSLTVFDTAEKENVSTRRLVFSITLSGKVYKAYVSKSQEETEDLIELIVMITLAIVLLLLIVLFFINRFVLNKLWHPFNNTLKELQQFNFHSTASLQLTDNNITEFRALNKAVTTMGDRVASDYAALKSFTENASHEIQTPLAIINSKIELLMQAENFSENQLHDFLTIQEEAARLSKLNKSLLLLTKIDNDQFHQSELVDLHKIVQHYTDKYEELLITKRIALTKEVAGNCEVIMNESMAQVLISNLVNNAIRHNIDNGYINIKIDSHQLLISNTGALLSMQPNELFERFTKAGTGSDSLGLGLAIVKKICELYGFTISYTYLQKMHQLAVDFLPGDKDVIKN